MENKKENRGYNRDNKSDRGARDEFKQEGSYRKFGSRDGREKQDPEDLIYGIRAVIEAIKNEVELNRILIQKGMDKELFTELKDTLKGKDFQLQFVPIEKLNKITASNHQGVIAYTSPVVYQNIEELTDKWLSEGKEPCVLVLDRITDVRNFGGIARTAACMGVDAILIPSKGSATVTADAVKTSAGALHSIPVCKTDLLKDSLFYLQQSGFQLVSCTEKSKVSVENYSFFGPTAIVLGSEENGISHDLLKMSDVRLSVPMAGDISSLNVGVATGMILYERLRQLKNA
ncbi:MAG: 23S rRNA (guanosine(2251)-2'-O)-methyltransferase RlmB [Bacteroidota bacterium]